MGFQDDFADRLRGAATARGSGGVDADAVRHPELGSGPPSIEREPEGILKRVQDDDGGGDDKEQGSDDGGPSTGPGQTDFQATGLGQTDEITDTSGLPQETVTAPPLTLPHDYRPRAGGWSRRKMVDFLEALAATCSVEQAAESVSMSRSAAYRLRARLAGTPFDLAWEAALENGLRQVAHAALDRAVNGVMQPVFYKGEQVGERRVYNERLTWLLLSQAGDIGRTALAREHGLDDWDGLLDRVEHGALDWEQDAIDAARQEPMTDVLKDHIATQSEYGSKWTAQAAVDIADWQRSLSPKVKASKKW